MTWSAINEFSAILANFLLTHACLMLSVKRSRKLGAATALVLWWKYLEFHGKKNLFAILKAYVYALFYYNFSFDPSLWWPLLLSMISIKGHTQVPISC